MTEFKNRHEYVGASEVAAVLGRSPYSTPAEVQYSKLNRSSFAGNELMHWGNLLEPVVLDEYESRTGTKVVERQAEFRYQRVKCHVDGITYQNGERHSIIEVKTTRQRPWVEVPVHYEIQVQVQAFLSQIERALVVALHQGSEMVVYAVEIDLERGQQLVQEASEWYERHVVDGEAVIPGSTAEARQVWPQHEEGRSVEASDRVAALVANLASLKRRLKHSELEVESTELQIEQAMGDAESLVHDGRVLATWKRTKDYTTLDYKAVRESLSPEDRKRYSKVVAGTRRLKIMKRGDQT